MARDTGVATTRYTRALHIHYREGELLPHLTPPCQALLRSQSGPHAAAWLTAIPSEPALTIASDHFQTALRRRLRLPLALADQRCGGGGNPGCGAVVDPYTETIELRAHVQAHGSVFAAKVLEEKAV